MARDSDGFPVPVKVGRSVTDDGEGWTAWALYSADDPDVARLLREQAAFEADNQDTQNPFDLAFELSGWEAYYGGPGRPYSAGPSVRIVRKRVLVTMCGGYDV